MAFFFSQKVLLVFLFLYVNIMWRVLIRSTSVVASNEYQQLIFLWRNKKQYYDMWIPIICSYENIAEIGILITY